MFKTYVSYIFDFLLILPFIIALLLQMVAICFIWGIIGIGSSMMYIRDKVTESFTYK
jgi:hypothetical protein